MRTQMIGGKVNMLYPEEVCHINDRNVINLKSLTAEPEAVGGAFSFSNSQGVVATVVYNSEQSELTFNLYSVLKKMIGEDVYATIGVSGSVTYGNSSSNITPFSLKLTSGKSLHSRPHNAERIAYWYDSSDLLGFEFLNTAAGTINGTPVQSGINKTNLSGFVDITVTQVDGGTTRTIKVKKAAIGGDNSLQTGCEDEDTTVGLIKVRYINTDGCLRYLQGKVINRKRTVGLTEWRADDLVRHTPNVMITATTDEITVGFPNIEREAYAEDIMFSPVIEYQRQDGEWEPCTVSSKNLQLNDWDTNDIEITIKTLA